MGKKTDASADAASRALQKINNLSPQNKKKLYEALNAYESEQLEKIFRVIPEKNFSMIIHTMNTDGESELAAKVESHVAFHSTKRILPANKTESTETILAKHGISIQNFITLDQAKRKVLYNALQFQNESIITQELLNISPQQGIEFLKILNTDPASLEGKKKLENCLIEQLGEVNLITFLQTHKTNPNLASRMHQKIKEFKLSNQINQFINDLNEIITLDRRSIHAVSNELSIAFFKYKTTQDASVFLKEAELAIERIVINRGPTVWEKLKNAMDTILGKKTQSSVVTDFKKALQDLQLDRKEELREQTPKETLPFRP